MVIKLGFLLLVLAVDVQGDSISSRLKNCGDQQGCWLVPPGCEQSSGPVCMGIIGWTVTQNDITFTMITYTSDLKQGSMYGAVGLSLDSFMGDDMVFVCAVNGSGKGQVYLMWNDQYSPERLYEPSKILINETLISMVDSRMNCQFKWTFASFDRVSKFRYKLYNLSLSHMKFYLLFARGQANPNTLNTYPHSILDGPLFPFISSEIVSFCETGCGQAEGMPWITQTHQAQIPQTLRQKISIFHIALMLSATFIFFPTAIMSARFNKGHSLRCCRVYMWFHIHWICNFLGVASTSVAFFSIYYEAYFKVLQCSSECGDVSFNRRSHAIYGTVAYSLILFQALMGMCRPTITSVFRPRFNLVHTFMGYSIWLLCCGNCILGVKLKKPGLAFIFNRYPENLVWIGIYCVLICFVICEWIVNKDRYLARNPDEIEPLRQNSEAKLLDDEEVYEGPSCVPMIVITFNAISGLCTTMTIVLMSLRSAKAMGFNL